MPFMNRRCFVTAAVSFPLVYSVAGAAKSLATEAAGVNYLFYDERFIDSVPLAARLPTSGMLIPVQGDVTSIWINEVNTACRNSPLILRGVTTESFYFCLEIMLRSEVAVVSQIARVSTDLFFWTIRSDPSKNG